MRLNRALRILGAASRRRSEELIAEGRVTVEGKVVTDPACSVDLQDDRIALDGEPLKIPRKGYYKFYKPSGVITSMRDESNRPDVRGFLEGLPPGTVPAGRLDRLSEGLIILTNDGDLLQKLIHPKHQIKRVYSATCSGELTTEKLEKLRKGLTFKGIFFKPDLVKTVSLKRSGCELEIHLHRGRYHEVRRMLSALGLRVNRLIRTSFGSVSIGRMKPGEIRALTKEELKRIVELSFI